MKTLTLASDHVKWLESSRASLTSALAAALSASNGLDELGIERGKLSDRIAQLKGEAKRDDIRALQRISNAQLQQELLGRDIAAAEMAVREAYGALSGANDNAGQVLSQVLTLRKEEIVTRARDFLADYFDSIPDIDCVVGQSHAVERLRVMANALRCRIGQPSRDDLAQLAQSRLEQISEMLEGRWPH
jgi:hypothetical protein